MVGARGERGAQAEVGGFASDEVDAETTVGGCDGLGETSEAGS